MSNSDRTCLWILQRGPRKGQICGKLRFQRSNRCYSHRMKLFFVTEHNIYFDNIPLNSVEVKYPNEARLQNLPRPRIRY